MEGEIKILDPKNFPNYSEQKEVTWKVREVRGSEVFKREGFPETKEECKELKVGDKIAVQSLTGYMEMEVVEVEDKRGYAKNESWGVDLEYTDDGRDCWVSWGFVNLKGLEKLEIRR